MEQWADLGITGVRASIPTDAVAAPTRSIERQADDLPPALGTWRPKRRPRRADPGYAGLSARSLPVTPGRSQFLRPPPAAQAPWRPRRRLWIVGTVVAVIALVVADVFTTNFGAGLRDGFQKGFSGATPRPRQPTRS